MSTQSQTQENPNFDINLEKCLLGGLMLLGGEGMDAVSGLIGPGDFYQPSHQYIFEALQSLDGDIDPVTTYARLKQMGKGDMVREYDLVDYATSTFASVVEIKPLAQMLKMYSTRRSLWLILQEMANELRSPEPINPYALVGDVQRKLEELSEPLEMSGFKEVLQSYVKHKEGLFHRTAQEQSISWGVPAWDEVIGKIYPTQFIALAGSAGAGKSLMLAHFVEKWLRQGVRVGFVSLEMASSEVLDRLTEIMSGINPESVIYSQDKQGWDRMVKCWGELYKKPFHLIDKVIDVEQIPSLYHQWRREAGAPIKVLVVDYAGLLLVKQSNKQAIFERLAHVSRYLKQFAMEYNVAVVAAIQLNREGYNSSSPSLKELGGTIAFAQDPNIVLSVWRPNLDKPNELRLKVLKNRSRYAGRVVNMVQDGLNLKILTRDQ